MSAARPRLLDLFSGAGGAAVGYERAGWQVTGIDVEPQPRYPFAFLEEDALAFVARCGHLYDAIHASPPCQAWTEGNRRYPEVRARYPKLIAPVRRLLEATGRPYVIENVMGAKAELRGPFKICGASVGLPQLQRHRLFECPVPILVPRCGCRKNGVQKLGVYGEKPDGRRLNSTYGTARAPRDLAEGRAAMGIDWMEWDELTEAIPPAYTRLIGEQLRRYME
jgi:DNA (cytosine-5)-methyltransferase 1